MNHILSSPRRTFVCLTSFATLVASLLFTGCGAGTSAATGADPLNTGGTMTGKIYGGNQPIIGATISLYSVGTSGYGSPGTLYATATTTTPYGGFAFTQTTAGTPINTASSTYGCPTSGNPQMYLVATGGNPGLTAVNPNAAGILAIGKCSTVGSIVVDMNEVTTVATMAAMQQFFNPKQTISGTTSIDSIGSPNTTQAMLGLANAQSTIATLANIGNGTANASFQPTSGVGGVTMFAFPEQSKINTIANVLAACINSTGASGSLSNPNPCDTLFAKAIPQTASLTSQPGATFVAATDTVQAAYYMLSNPTNGVNTSATSGNLTALFNLAVPQPPFSPSLASAPTDWTIGVNYFPSDTAADASTFVSTTCTGAASAPYFAATMKNIAVDALGTVWFNGGSSTGNNVLGQLSPTGAPQACYSGALAVGVGLVIDTTGNVYSANLPTTSTTGAIYEVPKAGVGNPGTPFSWTATSLSGITVDKTGNLFYVPSSAAPIQEFKGASAVTSASITKKSVGASLSAANTYLYVAADTTGRVFAPSAAGFFADLYVDTGGTNGYTDYNIGSITASVPQVNNYGVAVDSASSVFSGVTCCGTSTGDNNKIFKLAITNPTTTGNAPTLTETLSAKYAGGAVAPRGIAIDGAGNVWFGTADPVLNAASSPSGADVYAVGELDNTLTVSISPNGIVPATCSATGPNCQTKGGFQKAAFNLGSFLAIDPSGNVWVTVQNTGASSIEEIVGQAVPTVTPIIANPGTKP